MRSSTRHTNPGERFSWHMRSRLPRVSRRLGKLVRTNSESINAVTAPGDERDFAKSVAISSSIYPDPDTHVDTNALAEPDGSGRVEATRVFRRPAPATP